MRLSVATPASPRWRQCHASTLIEGTDGDLLVAFFAGTAEGAEDTAIHLVRGQAGGAGITTGPAPPAPADWSWSAPKTLTDVRQPHWNPVLARSPSGRLTLFFKRGGPISRWQTWVASSGDNGRTWSSPVELVPGDRGGRGPVKNPPVVLAGGRWVAGASTESEASHGVTTTWDSFADISDDDGVTWTRSADIPIDHATIPGPGIIQPTVWIGDGALVFLMRSTTGRAWLSRSTDQGRTWSPAQETDLPNNNSGLCAARLPDGRVVCAHNTSGVPWGPRNELALSVSSDDGQTWRTVHLVDRLPAPRTTITGRDAGVETDGRGELSYPTVVASARDVHISYTRERRHIVVATVPIASLADPSAVRSPPVESRPLHDVNT